MREQLLFYRHRLLFSYDHDATGMKIESEKDFLGQGVLVNQLWGSGEGIKP